jgi:hypothetical protein
MGAAQFDVRPLARLEVGGTQTWAACVSSVAMMAPAPYSVLKLQCSFAPAVAGHVVERLAGRACNALELLPWGMPPATLCNMGLHLHQLAWHDMSWSQRLWQRSSARCHTAAGTAAPQHGLVCDIICARAWPATVGRCAQQLQLYCKSWVTPKPFTALPGRDQPWLRL